MAHLTKQSAISAAAVQLLTDIAMLATDLTAVHTAVGTFKPRNDSGTFTVTVTV